jgi:hypothetical protein
MKQGKNKNSYSFQSDAFNGFLQSPQLHLINKSVSQQSILKCTRHWAYLIGKTSGDTCRLVVTLVCSPSPHNWLPTSFLPLLTTPYHHPSTMLTSQRSTVATIQERRTDVKGQYIHIYTDTRMFIAQFLCQGWFQVYTIWTHKSGICDIETEGNSVVMCSCP